MWGSAVRVCPGLHGGRGDWLSRLEHRLCKPGVVGSSPTFSTKAGGRESGPLRGSLTGWERADTKTSDTSGGARGRAATMRARARSEARRTEDALAPGGEEGRGRPRKSTGRRERPLIRGCPNGATRRAEARHPPEGEANPTNRNIPVVGGEENKSDPPSSGERKGASPNRGRRGARGVAGPA